MFSKCCLQHQRQKSVWTLEFVHSHISNTVNHHKGWLFWSGSLQCHVPKYTKLYDIPCYCISAILHCIRVVTNPKPKAKNQRLRRTNAKQRPGCSFCCDFCFSSHNRTQNRTGESLPRRTIRTWKAWPKHLGPCPCSFGIILSQMYPERNQSFKTNLKRGLLVHSPN